MGALFLLGAALIAWGWYLLANVPGENRDQGSSPARFTLVWAALLGGCIAVWVLCCGGGAWLAGGIG